MKPHKHCELIKAWADGAEIESYSKLSHKWVKLETPAWEQDCEYRIKPEPKTEPIKIIMYIYNNPTEGKTWISSTKLPYANSIYCQYIGSIEVLK